MLLTVNKVMDLQPCITREALMEYAGDRTVMSLSDALRDDKIPVSARIWLGIAVMSKNAQILFTLMSSLGVADLDLSNILKWVYEDAGVRDLHSILKEGNQITKYLVRSALCENKKVRTTLLYNVLYICALRHTDTEKERLRQLQELQEIHGAACSE